MPETPTHPSIPRRARAVIAAALAIGLGGAELPGRPAATGGLLGGSAARADPRAQAAPAPEPESEREGARAGEESSVPAEPWSQELVRLPVQLLQQRRTVEARRLLEPVVAEHPEWPEASFFLGLTYHFEQRYERSSELFERALELDPELDTPWVFYGWASYYLGRTDIAREAFDAFLAARPEHPEALYGLGLLDFDEDDIEAAESRFRRVIELAVEQGNAPTEAKARARLADVLIRTGDLSGAKEQLEASIELNPNNYEPYFKLSRVLQRLGDAAGAEAARRKHDEIRDRVLAGQRPPADGGTR